MAKVVTRRSIRGCEFLLLRPGRAGTHEDVRTAATGSVVIVSVGSNDGGVPRDGDWQAEGVTRRPIRGCELLLLRPGRPGTHEHVRTALTPVLEGSNDGSVPRDGD